MDLIVGAGFLGTRLMEYLSPRASAPIVAAVRDPAAAVPMARAEYVACDVTSPADVARLVRVCGGEALTVFYFAACHNVDHLYLYPEEARRVNVEALSRFLDTVPGIEKFFFASTDCVYGESPPGGAPFKETDACAPINEYGRQKLAAEAIVRAHGGTAVRFSYMMGPSPLKKRHFYDTLAEKLAAGEPIEMLDGMARSALSYETAAGLLARLAALPAGRLPDTVNLCGDREYTKYELGLKIAAACGADPALVRRLPEAAGQAFFKDRRARRIAMDNTRLKTLLGLGAVDFEGVTEC